MLNLLQKTRKSCWLQVNHKVLSGKTSRDEGKMPNEGSDVIRPWTQSKQSIHDLESISTSQLVNRLTCWILPLVLKHDCRNNSQILFHHSTFAILRQAINCDALCRSSKLCFLLYLPCILRPLFCMSERTSTLFESKSQAAFLDDVLWEPRNLHDKPKSKATNKKFRS